MSGTITAASTAVSGNLSVSGAVTAASPTVLSYSTMPTLASNQVGYTVQNFATSSVSVSNNVGTTIATWTLDVGVWLISYQLRLVSASTSTATYLETWVNSSAVANSQFGQNSWFGSAAMGGATAGPCMTGTFVATNTGSTTFTLSAYFSYSGGTISTLVAIPNADCYFQCTRLA